MRSEWYTDRPLNRPYPGPDGPPARETPDFGRRAVLLEDHPALGAVLEHLLSREGYEVELLEAGSRARPGPALLMVDDEERGGLHILRVRDAEKALERVSAEGSAGTSSVEAEGVRAFVPVPFGSGDVLRVVRAVSGFDGRKKSGSTIR